MNALISDFAASDVRDYNSPQLTQLVVAGFADGCDVVRHCESAVNDDTYTFGTTSCGLGVAHFWANRL